MNIEKNVEALQRFIGAGSVSIVKCCFEKCEDGELGVTNQGVFVIGLKKAQDVVLAKFSGVRNIEFRSGAYDEVVLGGLIIELMTDSQWPDVNVRVFSEVEDTTLSFYSTRVELQYQAVRLD